MEFWMLLLSLALVFLLKKLAFPPGVGPEAEAAAVEEEEEEEEEDGDQDERAALEWLQRTLPLIRAAFWDGERVQSKDERLVLWLQEVKRLLCDAEDVGDDIEYEELRRQIEGDGGGSGSASSLSKKVNIIKRRFLDAEKYKVGLGIGDVCGRSDEEVMQERAQQTSFLPIEPEIFGRDKEKEEIIRFLLASDDGNDGGGVVSSIAITGMGGLGKTTLAQIVYSDRRVVEHFKPRMWIFTTPDYDVMKLSREILGSIEMDIKFPWSLGNLDMCHRVIMDKLEGKRFLLVLDNLWDRDQRKWRSLLAPLMYAKKGSKILITTRDAGFANILQHGKTIELEGLPFDHCWKLFERHAFFDGSSAEYPPLEAIGKQIVDRFNGVPLAAAVVGDLLRSTLEESEWRRILESEMWEIDQGEDGVLSVLKLSYERLPPQLKQCLAYCSLFPKNYRFDRFDLVLQWMAQGFVHSERGGRIEDVGNRCFNDLFNRSFFQFVDGKYVVHDLIRDLAMLVSHRDHLSTDTDGLYRILRDNHSIRHLSLLMASSRPDLEDLERVLAHKCLRTLAFCFLSDSQCWVPHSLFLSLDTLRLLDLSYGGIEQLPDSIGNLRHLRYLDLGSNPIKILPESLCCLYKLQTLKLKGCCVHTKLPQGISQLINLRHLEVEPGCLSGVVGIGNLTCLQELESFIISKRRHGPKIVDLKDMNELRGSLCIQNLHCIRSKEEAMGAMLDRKQHLLKLKLEWDQYTYAGERNSKLDEEILEALVPPAGLKEFAIEGYHGESAPSWLRQQSLSNLESISLATCRNWSSLPISLCMFSLRRITISRCPQLKCLPPLPTTLKELVLRHLKLEELPEFYQPLSGHGSNIIPSLSTLIIEGCNALKSLRGGLLRLYLSNLSVLRIQRCHQIAEWPEGAGFLATLLSLQEDLCILGCPKLEAMPAGMALSPSLKRLVVTGSPEVVNEALLVQLQNLTSESYVSVEKDYTNLASCCEQVFKLVVADWLEIGDIRHVYLRSIVAPEDDPCLRLACGKQRVWSWRSNDWVHAWRVQIWPRRVKEEKKEEKKEEMMMAYHSSIIVPLDEWWERRSPPQRYVRGNPGILDVANTKHQERNSSISACSMEHHFRWASCIRWLVMDGAFHGTILPFNMTSLEGLWISCFRGPVPLLPQALLSHLTGLLELQIFDCPELTLSSLKEMIISLPSLQHLTIERCPKLSSSSPSCTHSVATTSSNAAKLQTLFLDDAKLLGDAQFVRDCLCSLRGLHIWYDRNLTSFTTSMEEGLRSLGPSLQHLSFYNCGMLDDLPSDMRSLLPSLRALSIRRCYELWCLPTLLPAFLCMLVLHECNEELAVRCRAPPPGRLAQQWQKQQTDWFKIAHIPVIVNNGFFVQGSYREFLELRAKWRDF